METHLGSITFKISNARVQKITVTSMIECKEKARSCTKEFSYKYNLTTDSKNFQCELNFAGSTWTQKNTSLICDSTELSLKNEILERAKSMKLNQIGGYNFHCPGDLYNNIIACLVNSEVISVF
jgi:hypothetical protein